MGKVKEWKEKYPDRVTEYQFPMGKVKMINSAFGVGGLRYQFPMGKVMYIKRLKSKKPKTCINSLWER